eukprot:scaffold154393_cov54-Attheya_sp.AAC.2
MATDLWIPRCGMMLVMRKILNCCQQENMQYVLTDALLTQFSSIGCTIEIACSPTIIVISYEYKQPFQHGVCLECQCIHRVCS